MNSLHPSKDNVIAFPPRPASEKDKDDAWKGLTVALLMKQNSQGGINPQILEALLVAAKVAP